MGKAPLQCVSECAPALKTKGKQHHITIDVTSSPCMMTHALNISEFYILAQLTHPTILESN